MIYVFKLFFQNPAIASLFIWCFSLSLNYETTEKKKSRNKINAAGSSERSFKKTSITRKGIVLLAAQDKFKELKYLMRKKGLRSRRLKAKHCLLKPGIQ